MSSAPVMTVTLRAGAAIAAAGILLGMLSACSPEPEPTPTKTALFASEEEAFAAAEETYRAYVTALNSVDPQDPETFEAVYGWTTGDANASAKETFTELHAERVTLTGETTIESMTLVSASPARGDVTIHLCANVSETDILDAAGQSLVPDGRAPIQSVQVNFITAVTTTGLKISGAIGSDSPCSS